MKLNIAFLASHNGTDMRVIIEAAEAKKLDIEPKVIISNNGDATALEYARDHNLPALHISTQTDADPDGAILEILRRYNADLVVLSGYMKKIGPKTLQAYSGKILNVHPALLPRYGGEGMYGNLVHAAVLKNGDRQTGCTIHLVDDQYDHGPIVAQKRVNVEKNDTVESLKNKVQDAEKVLYMEVLQDIINGTISLK